MVVGQKTQQRHKNRNTICNEIERGCNNSLIQPLYLTILLSLQNDQGKLPMRLGLHHIPQSSPLRR